MTYDQIKAELAKLDAAAPDYIARKARLARHAITVSVALSGHTDDAAVARHLDDMIAGWERNMPRVLETTVVRGETIAYIGTDDDGCTECRALGQVFADEDAAIDAIHRHEMAGTETMEETLRRQESERPGR